MEDAQKLSSLKTVTAGVIGSVLLLILVGWLVLAAAGIWIIYRIVKGAMYLSENRPLPAP